MFNKFSLNRLIVLITTLGFTFLLLDTTIEHWSMFNQELMVFIPLLFCVVVIVLGVFTIKLWKEKLIRWFQILFFASIIVGVAGLYFHIELFEEETNLSAEEIEHEANEKDKPLLAPLSFAGIAVIGLLGTMRKWEAEVKTHN